MRFVRKDAPWDWAQLAALKGWQSGSVHQYTCAAMRHDLPNGPRPALIPDTYGWTCPDPDCDYRQTWALFAVPGDDE